VKTCLICQGTAPLHHRQEFPAYALCSQCQAAGYQLTLGPDLAYCILIPTPPPGHSWLASCSQVASLLRQENIPPWLGPRARRNPHPPKNRSKEKNSGKMPAVLDHQ